MGVQTLRAILLCALGVLCLVLAPQSTLAATIVTSNITSDTEWTLAGSPYIIKVANEKVYDDSRFFTVEDGATLTVDSGVEIRFSLYNLLIIKGVLIARGTPESHITVTSFDEPIVDASRELSSTDVMVPLESQEVSDSVQRPAMIYVPPEAGIANAGGSIDINYATFTKAGLYHWDGHTALAHASISGQRLGMTMGRGELMISDSHIFNNKGSGIEHNLDGTLTISRSEIDHNETGITIYSNSGSERISDSSIHDNTSLAIANFNADVPVSAVNNWWGSSSGPFEGTLSGAVDYTPWLTRDPFSPDPCAVPGACVSNVLFLPGIEGSRLYEGTGCGQSAEEKLWEPVPDSLSKFLSVDGDRKVRRLSLDAAGKSVCSDIYTKQGDIIDSAGGSAIYKAFIDEMNGLEQGGTIIDWEPVAYDWRLSLNDLLTNGTEREGKIYYSEASSTPYIEQELRRLAASSKSGKVTIVAHSNGGLLAKALLRELGSESTALVDKLILVGAPQSGAPLGLAALLFGTDQEIRAYGNAILHASTARAFALNSPMAYHLVPSEDYLESTLPDASHPVIHFKGNGYTKEIAAYGSTIANRVALADFMTAKEGGREKPKAKNVNAAEILNSGLIDYAVHQHASLDFWTPPAGIETDQIAGWGVDTIAGIDFYSPRYSPSRLYKPIFTEDGDGTVTVPSAIMMASTTEVKRYWVDLHSYNKLNSTQRTHKDLLEIPMLEEFIKNKIRDTKSALPQYILDAQPKSTSDKKLIFYLHSPLSLELKDSLGNVTGIARGDVVSESIPGSSYGELGEVKYISVPEGEQYQLTLRGLDIGIFSLDIEESEGGVVSASSTIADVPTTSKTLATLSLTSLADASPLTVDVDGDGADDITLSPKSGEEVVYEPPSPPDPAPAPPIVLSYGGGTGAISIPSYIPHTLLATTTATSTLERIATTTLATSSSSRVQKVGNKKKVTVKAREVEPKATTTALVSTIPTSQHSQSSTRGATVYNGWYAFWSAIKRLF